MCSTSCPLTEDPAAFVWYKNREFLYEDWSPWYQELVSSEEAVRYSCAIKGYEDLRAPEVSVDFVSPNCYSVTYEKGKMCSHQLKSVDEPCSVTYPRDVRVQLTSERYHVALSCDTSCPVTDPNPAFWWYWDRKLFCCCNSQNITSFNIKANIFSCALKSNEDLYSDETCRDASSCKKVNYVHRRICAPEGSSVDISSVYTYSAGGGTKLWYKKMQNVEENDADLLTVAEGRVEYHDKKNLHTLRLIDLQKNDSGEYIFSLKENYKENEPSQSPHVMLIVTGLKVTMNPSSEVTQGQKVTLTCGTSCPLTESTTYVWYLNGQPLSGPVNQNKHVLLDPVDCQHAGNYSCAVRTPDFISSPEEVLTVKARGKSVTIMNGVKVAVLLLIPPVVFTLYFMMRKKQAASASVKLREKEQAEQVE
ncbi:uncharacterized protein PAE49_004225 [Odontesthes bonariensis]|uniref:uncharacterized protein LOC142379155 n=1 Tax=Odontesthes bonariensis TaxID=219752 RepID=UPI003F58F761